MKGTTKNELPRRALTPTELEMMNVIWRLGSCTVAQVLKELQPDRDLAYSSVSTIIRILEQKGFVTSKKVGRGHLYSAAMSKQEYQALSLQYVVRDIFDATPSLLVQRLLDSKKLTPKDLQDIRALLRKKVL